MACIVKLSHWKRPWCWKGLRAREWGDRGWDGWMASAIWETGKDWEAWRAALHGVTKSWTWLSHGTTAIFLLNSYGLDHSPAWPPFFSCWAPAYQHSTDARSSHCSHTNTTWRLLDCFAWVWGSTTRHQLPHLFGTTWRSSSSTLALMCIVQTYHC